jgi:hypothetical protein
MWQHDWQVTLFIIIEKAAGGLPEPKVCSYPVYMWQHDWQVTLFIIIEKAAGGLPEPKVCSYPV